MVRLLLSLFLYPLLGAPYLAFGSPAPVPAPPPGRRRRAYLYIRKSKVRSPEPVKDTNGNPVLDANGMPVMTTPRMISPEVQLQEALRKAAEYGYKPEDIVVLEDLGISGRKGRERRPSYSVLLTAIEGNEVEMLFSYSLSRLSRKVADIVALAELCAAHGVKIHLARDFDPDPTSPSGRLIMVLLGAFAAWEAEITSERMIDLADYRRKRGDKLGGQYYPHPEKVRDAFLKVGTYADAARALTADGVPTRNGLRVWSATAVKGILAREYPELLPHHPSSGASSRMPYRFHRMVRCHCGRWMTGRRDTRKPNGSLGAIRYICLQGRLDPEHGGGAYIPESRVRSAVEEELRFFHLPFDAVAEDHEAASRARLAALRDERDQIGFAFARRMLSEEAATRQQEALDREVEAIELAGVVQKIDPTIPWDDEEAANERLSLIFEEIRVTPEMQVAEVVWRVPEFRSAAA